MGGILAGVRVLDLAHGLAGSVAALLLAEAGADVVKVEPPGGGPQRGGAAFAVWNRSKQTVALDVARADRAALQTLLRGADVLIHDLSWAAARRQGLDAATLKALAPSLIVCAIAGFPKGHPDADLPTDDVLVLAAAGIMDEQKAVRREGPVYLRFPLGSWGAAWLAACGVLARLLHVRRGGEAGPVSTSLFQGALVPMIMHWRRAETPTPSLAAGMSKTGSTGLLECADGVWLHFMGASPEKAPMMQATLGAMSATDIATANAAHGGANANPNWGALTVALKTRPSAQWLADFWAADVAVQPAVPMGEIYFDEQARVNDYVIAVDDPRLGRTLQPGHPFSVNPPAGLADRKAEAKGDAATVIERWTPREPRTGGRTSGRPLEGLKVVDLGNFLAGPIAAMLLADLGAEVVKAEAVTGDQMRYVEWAFAGCQRGKRSLAIDMKAPDAQAVMARLVKDADVLHHNLRMPAAERLGLGYERMAALNPRLVYCHVSSYGPKGPRKDWPGYDQLFQASSGWEFEGAGEGNPPMWHRFGMMDHQAGMASLFATLLGLYERERSGEGQLVSASLLGASLFTVSETIVLPSGALAPYDRLDADQTGVAPWKRIYACAGGWIALSATKQDFARCLSCVGASGVRTFAQALENLTQAEALETLAEAGVAVAPVRLDQGPAFFDDPANRRIGLVATYPHPVYGRFEQPGALWSFGDLDLALDRAPPTLGQHSREVLSEIGYGPEEIDRLVAQKVIGA